MPEQSEQPELAALHSSNPTAAELARAQHRSPLLVRPGFLIRRLHQIHCSLFLEETEAFNITPVQYSLMTAISRHGEADQITIAREVGLERTTVAEVLVRLERRGILVRRPAPHDRRVRLVKLTPSGRALIRKMAPAVQRAHDRTLDVLPVDEQQSLLLQLIRVVEAKNDAGAAPFRF